MSSKFFSLPVALLALFLFVLLIIVAVLPSPYPVATATLLLAFALVLINAFRLIRRDELGAVTRLLRSIRLNLVRGPAEITLPPTLKAVQDEISQMYKKNQADIEYLRKLERVRTEFLGNVSHELKTPLFAVQGFLETLRNGAMHDPQVNIKFLDKALTHTGNLASLLNDLIDISMIETGEMRMSFRYFPLNELLESVVEELHTKAEDKYLTLKYLPPLSPFHVFGDRIRLRQVMINLVDNAIKYTEKGGVEIATEDLGRFCRIIVNDTGPGIPIEDQERIFERFYRVDKTRSREVGGTGLGLAIAKHIAEAHGSKIELRSTPANGSVFSFVLKK